METEFTVDSKPPGNLFTIYFFIVYQELDDTQLIKTIQAFYVLLNTIGENQIIKYYNAHGITINEKDLVNKNTTEQLVPTQFSQSLSLQDFCIHYLKKVWINALRISNPSK